MIPDSFAKQLHAQATRGETLAAEERAALEAWYVVQDRRESQTLGLTTDSENRLTIMQAQVDGALDQLTTLTTRIRKIASENETLRQEISVLRRQLAHQAAASMAA